MKNLEFVCHEPESLCGIFKRDWIEKEPNYHFLGVPLDISASYRAGARYGPDNFRKILQSENFECVTEKGIILQEYYKVKDWGNIGISPVSLKKSLQFVSEAVNDLILNEQSFLVFGGDHSTTIGIGHAFEEANLPTYLIYLDAHLDLYEENMETSLSHACTLRRFSEISGFQGAAVLGYRDFKPEHINYANSAKIKIFSTSDLIEKTDLHQFGFSLAQSVPKKAKRVHVSVDLDVLDPSVAPAVGNPVAGGLSLRNLICVLTGIFQGLKSYQIFNWDISEFNPLYDLSEITAFAIVKLFLESLGAQVPT
ncbi:MAG: arginase family protein [Candidatus Hodarchaeales archaeon]